MSANDQKRTLHFKRWEKTKPVDLPHKFFRRLRSCEGKILSNAGVQFVSRRAEVTTVRAVLLSGVVIIVRM